MSQSDVDPAAPLEAQRRRPLRLCFGCALARFGLQSFFRSLSAIDVLYRGGRPCRRPRLGKHMMAIKSLKSDGFLRFFVSKSQHRMKQGIFGGQDSFKIAFESYLEAILTSQDALFHPMLRF